MAVVETNLQHINQNMEQIKREAEQRSIKQSQDTRMVLDELNKLRLELESGKGFAKGIRFSANVIWALTGGVVVAALMKIFS